MVKTKQWAETLAISTANSIPPADAADYEVQRSASEIARRTIVLHAVAAVGYGVGAQPIVDWLRNQGLWSAVSQNEKRLFVSTDISESASISAQWRQEAAWTLLWAIQKVGSLGLPTSTCDTTKLVDEIMPSLGDAIDPFVSKSRLRSHGELLAEEDRIYNLHCYARKAHRDGSMPEDMVYDVLYQRHYAFEWLAGEDWDDVRVDT